LAVNRCFFTEKAQERDRTADLILTKDVLCRLSYLGISSAVAVAGERETGFEPATLSLEG
jgi:hypothetical protein